MSIVYIAISVFVLCLLYVLYEIHQALKDEPGYGGTKNKDEFYG